MLFGIYAGEHLRVRRALSSERDGDALPAGSTEPVLVLRARPDLCFCGDLDLTSVMASEENQVRRECWLRSYIKLKVYGVWSYSALSKQSSPPLASDFIIIF